MLLPGGRLCGGGDGGAEARPVRAGRRRVRPRAVPGVSAGSGEMGHRDPGAGGQGLKLSAVPPWHAVTVSANATAAGLSASHRRTAQPVASGGSAAIGTSRSAGWAATWRPGSRGTTAWPTPSSGGVPVGDAGGARGRHRAGFPLAEVTVEAHTGRGVLREPDVPDTGQFLGLDPLPGGERVIGVYGEHPRQTDHRMLLDTGDRRPAGRNPEPRTAVRFRVPTRSGRSPLAATPPRPPVPEWPPRPPRSARPDRRRRPPRAVPPQGPAARPPGPPPRRSA